MVHPVHAGLGLPRIACRMPLYQTHGSSIIQQRLAADTNHESVRAAQEGILADAGKDARMRNFNLATKQHSRLRLRFKLAPCSGSFSSDGR